MSTVALEKELKRVRHKNNALTNEKKALESQLKRFFANNEANICYSYWVDIKNCDPSQSLYDLWSSEGIRLGRLIWSTNSDRAIDYPVDPRLIYNLPAFLLSFPGIVIGWEPPMVEEVLSDFKFFEKLKIEAILEYGEFKSDEDLYLHCRIEFLNTKKYPYPA